MDEVEIVVTSQDRSGPGMASARKNTKDLTLEVQNLDKRIGQHQASVRELGLEYARTGDKRPPRTRRGRRSNERRRQRPFRPYAATSATAGTKHASA